MKANYSKIILGALCGLLVYHVSAQDERFTQVLANPLRLNPAVMGSNSDLKVILDYRKQWGVVEKGYRTISATALYPLYIKDGDDKLDIGASFLKDNEGAFSTLDAALAIGYNLKVSNSGFLSFSIMGGYVQKSLDVANLTYDDQYVLGTYSSSNTTSEAIQNEKTAYPDVGFGMMWYFAPDQEAEQKLNAYVGVSGYHLNKPTETHIDGSGYLPRKFSFQGGVKIIGKNRVDYTPNVIVNTQSGAEEIAAGIYVDFRFSETSKLIFGTWYRRKDAIPFMLGFEHNNFMLGYSYDLTSSRMSRAISGLHTHEIAVAFKLNMAEKKGIDVSPSFF